MERRGLVFAAAIISGISIYLNKFAVSGINSSVFTFLKNSVVAVFLLSILFSSLEYKSLLTLKRKAWLELAAIGLIGGSIPFLLFFKGLQLTSAVNASFLQKTMFIFVMVLGTLFLKERLDKWIILAAALTVVGLALFLNIVPSMNLGAWLVLGATILWSVENVISKQLLRSLSGNMVAFGRMFFGSFFILLYLLFTGQYTLISGLSIAQWQWVALTSAFLVAYVITWYNGLKLVKATTATAVLLFGSLITTALSYLFDTVAVTVSQAVGIVLVLAGIIGLIGFYDVWVSTLRFWENVRQRWA